MNRQKKTHGHGGERGAEASPVDHGTGMLIDLIDLIDLIPLIPARSDSASLKAAGRMEELCIVHSAY